MVPNHLETMPLATWRLCALCLALCVVPAAAFLAAAPISLRTLAQPGGLQYSVPARARKSASWVHRGDKDGAARMVVAPAVSTEESWVMRTLKLGIKAVGVGMCLLHGTFAMGLCPTENFCVMCEHFECAECAAQT